MWRFTAARARGTSHLKTGQPCQDQFACATFPDGTLAVVLADGAGSATFGERGAELAVTCMLTALRRGLEAGRRDFSALLRDGAGEARFAVTEEARANGEAPRDYASTLLAAVLGPFGGGALQIGDGVIVVNGGGAGWSWVFWPQRGEYANTTFFLTDENAEASIEVEDFSGEITAIALMSDGLEPLALHYQGRSAHAPFFDGMFRVLDAAVGEGEIAQLSDGLGRFLASEPVTSRTDDDVSLVLARRVP